MLRAVLLGLLVVSAAACGKSSTESAAKVQPGVAAGKVLEVKGSVTVKHAGVTRPLAVGESVEGDDTVSTGADGNVVIELAHNSARWELGANKTQKVSESIAWNAKKATAQEIDEASAAAGRPAERSAAGTVATADEPEAAEAEREEKKEDSAPAPQGAMAPPSAAPAEAAAPDMQSKGSAPAPVGTRRRVAAAPKADAMPAPAPPPPPPKPIARATAANDDAVVVPHTRGKAKEPPMAPPRAQAAASPGATSAGPGGGGGGGAPPAGGASIGATEGAIASPAALIGARSAALHKCLVDAGAKDDVTLVVDVTNGTATVKLSSKAAIAAGLDKCVKSVVAGIHFTGTAKVTRVVKP